MVYYLRLNDGSAIALNDGSILILNLIDGLPQRKNLSENDEDATTYSTGYSGPSYA